MEKNSKRDRVIILGGLGSMLFSQLICGFGESNSAPSVVIAPTDLRPTKGDYYPQGFANQATCDVRAGDELEILQRRNAVVTGEPIVQIRDVIDDCIGWTRADSLQ